MSLIPALKFHSISNVSEVLNERNLKKCLNVFLLYLIVIFFITVFFISCCKKFCDTANGKKEDSFTNERQSLADAMAEPAHLSSPFVFSFFLILLFFSTTCGVFSILSRTIIDKDTSQVDRLSEHLTSLKGLKNVKTRIKRNFISCGLEWYKRLFRVDGTDVHLIQSKSQSWRLNRPFRSASGETNETLGYSVQWEVTEQGKTDSKMPTCLECLSSKCCRGMNKVP